jgi:hypothetical protein
MSGDCIRLFAIWAMARISSPFRVASACGAVDTEGAQCCGEVEIYLDAHDPSSSKRPDVRVAELDVGVAVPRAHGLVHRRDDSVVGFDEL